MQTKLPSNGPRGRDQIPSLRDASFFDPGFPVIPVNWKHYLIDFIRENRIRLPVSERVRRGQSLYQTF